MQGETINGYTVTKLLGQGGMGRVWMAEKPRGVKVAIKFLLPEFCSDSGIVQRFYNEARAAQKIKHAGITQIFDIGQHLGHPFLIMELLEGKTLAERLDDARHLPSGRLSISHVAELGKQIAGVLKATHAARVIHRDLKPENIFLIQDDELPHRERVKILDFGIAKFESLARLTEVGKGMGTLAYSAPEQWIDAVKADARADVYSFGCIAFEMCTGRLAFEHMMEVPPRPSAFAPELPPELDEIIARALAKQPDERPSIHEIYGVLSTIAARNLFLETMLAPNNAVALTPGGLPAAGDIADAHPKLPSTAKEAPRARPPRRWSVLTYVLLGVAVAAAVGLVVWWTARLRRHGEPSMANRWVRITAPAAQVTLGLRTDNADPTVRGFRPAKNISSPTAAYAIQEHEVTWSEIEPWLTGRGAAYEAPPWAEQASVRATLPATGIDWELARTYCESLGGSLPTEEQWEYAARGPERRPNSWGSNRLDRQLTRAYAGPSAVPDPVKSSAQDRTPHPGPVLYDMVGNAQEWTLDLWRTDRPSEPDEWVATDKGTSIRAIRGLPLDKDPRDSIQDETAAYREELCATGACVEKTMTKLRYVGFRCARPVPDATQNRP